MQLTTYGKLNAAQYALENQEPPEEAFAFYWQQYEVAEFGTLRRIAGFTDIQMSQPFDAANYASCGLGRRNVALAIGKTTAMVKAVQQVNRTLDH